MPKSNWKCGLVGIDVGKTHGHGNFTVPELFKYLAVRHLQLVSRLSGSPVEGGIVKDVRHALGGLRGRDAVSLHVYEVDSQATVPRGTTL